MGAAVCCQHHATFPWSPMGTGHTGLEVWEGYRGSQMPWGWHWLDSQVGDKGHPRGPQGHPQLGLGLGAMLGGN